MFGFARRRMATFRRRVATHAGGSSTVTMSVGARFVTKINSAVSQILPKRFPRFESESIATSKLPGLPREKVLATVVRLLERTFIRIGNDEYARQNKSFGLTTIKDRHVTVRGAHLRFRFRGKSGRQHEVDMRDGQVAKIVSKLQDLRGQELFQYIEENGEVRDVRSQDVNDYLREITNEDFSAKDFRTWAGTLLSALALNVQGGFETKGQAKANIKTAICAVAELLGNTPAICRRCYVHPAVVEAYLASTRIPGLSQAMQKSGNRQLRLAEAAVLRFLRSQNR